MSALPLSWYVTITSISERLPHIMAGINSWHRYGMKKLRHYHPMYWQWRIYTDVKTSSWTNLNRDSTQIAILTAADDSIWQWRLDPNPCGLIWIRFLRDAVCKEAQIANRGIGLVFQSATRNDQLTYGIQKATNLRVKPAISKPIT